MKSFLLSILIFSFISCQKSEPEQNISFHNRDGFINLGEGKTRQYTFNDVTESAGYLTTFPTEAIEKKIPEETLDNWTLEYYIYTSFEDAELAMVEYLEMSSIAMLNMIDSPLVKGQIGDNCWYQLPLGSIRFIRNNILISIWPKNDYSSLVFTSVENIAREIDQIIIASPKIKDTQLIPAPKVNSIEMVSDLPKDWENIVKIKVNATDANNKQLFFRKYADAPAGISETGYLIFSLDKYIDYTDVADKAKVKIWIWNEDHVVASVDQYVNF